MRLLTAGSLTLVALAVFGGGATAGAQGGEVVDSLLQADKELSDLRKAFAKAKGKRTQSAAEKLGEAQTHSFQAIQQLLRGGEGTLLSCGERASIIQSLARLDVFLELATDEDFKRNDALGHAEVAAANLQMQISRCQSADATDEEFVVDAVKTTEKLLRRYQRGTLKKNEILEAAARTASAKGDLLADERIHECEAYNVFVIVERITRQTQLAYITRNRKRRDKILDEAILDVDLLANELKLMPCGETTPTPTPEPEPNPQPTTCGTATAIVFAGNERRFDIGNCGPGYRQAVNITSLTLTIPSNTITNELPPSGGTCQATSAGGNATYSCTGSMGQNVSLNLDFLNSPAGQSASYSVNGGQYSGSIAIP